MKKILISIFLAILSNSCGKPTLGNKETNNVEVPIALLFESEGCKIYRFEEAGRYGYFTHCSCTYSENNSTVK